jgi:D-serine deaminase-like pyridoxal phosphate-dependent protein
VLTHAGQSYDATSVPRGAEIAEQERAAVVQAAGRLRPRASRCRMTGSTPTAVRELAGRRDRHAPRCLHTLFDLAQTTLGSCTVDDIAVSVLTTVIGHNPRSQRMLIDAGALALSKDVSANRLGGHVGFGLICPINGGRPLADMHVADVNQEHGLIGAAESCEIMAERFPVGNA